MVGDVAALQALAHPVRLGIVHHLAERPETCACDLTELFNVSQPTIRRRARHSAGQEPVL